MLAPAPRTSLTDTAAPQHPILEELLIDTDANRQPPPRPTPAATRNRAVLLALSVVLIAFNLRPVFSSLSVLLPEIMAASGLSPTGASLLTTLPVLCLGLFAPLSPWLARRLGLERALLGCMALIVLGTLARGSGSVALLFIASAVAGVGIAINNVLVTVLIKRDFPRRAALVMGLYTMAVCGGAAAAAGMTVPLEQTLGGGWTRALALWAVPAAIVTLLWAPQALPIRPRASEAGMTVPGLWRDPLAWQVMLFMGLQSSLAYIVMGWLAPMLRERGMGAAAAGYVLSLCVMTQVAACLVMPLIAVRCRNQVGAAVAVALLAVAALLACLFAPLSGVWVWAALLGIALGGAFALALTLIVLRSPDAHVAAQLSGMAQGGGYLVAAWGPLLVGLLRGWTGSFHASAYLILLIGAALVASALGAGRARYVRAVAVPR